MKKLLTVLVAMGLLGACAKKSDDFAAQYAKNSAGATAVNADQNGQMAANAGVTMDILEMRTVSEKPITFANRLAVDNQIVTVQMVQSLTNPTIKQSGTVTIGNYQVQLTGACANSVDCSPYYIVALVSQNGAPKLQYGMKFYRTEPTAARDVFQIFDAAHVTTFENMAALLNTK